MVIERTVIPSLLCVVLLLLLGGLLMRDHIVVEKRQARIIQKLDDAAKREKAADARLAGIEEMIRQHVSR